MIEISYKCDENVDIAFVEVECTISAFSGRYMYSKQIFNGAAKLFADRL